MSRIFKGASNFNQDLSNWDVSAVTDMRSMFHGASAFKRELCGSAWVKSKAKTRDMFLDSPGSISSTVRTPARTGYVEGEGYGYCGCGSSAPSYVCTPTGYRACDLLIIKSAV